MKTVLHWFRRDLRLTDNTALNAAVAAAGERVVTVYVLSRWSKPHHWAGPNRQEFLCGCLASLAKNLTAIGGRLLIRCGDAADELEKLLVEAKADAIYCNRDPDPFGRATEDRVAAMSARHGATFHAEKDAALHERDELLTGAGHPYRVYSPYLRAWMRLEKPAVGRRVKKLAPPPAVLDSLPLPELAHWGLRSEGARIATPGERAARQRMRTFLSPEGGVADYATRRNVLGDNTSSRFSQDLRWGLISIREIHHLAREAAAEGPPASLPHVDKFLAETAWREFYMQILHYFPEVLADDFNPGTRGLPWRWEQDDPEAFACWREGRTGFPLVDAAMRQLNGLGYMHNRLRIVTAMFLTKDLRIHWREGEALFMRKLVDGEIANNNGNWQWSAGTGADAAPYFRIQNPWTQSTRFDADGAFIHEWVPELRGVSPASLHAPPAPGARLAKDYPLPMVDHAVERKRTLEMFEAHAASRPRA